MFADYDESLVCRLFSWFVRRVPSVCDASLQTGLSDQPLEFSYDSKVGLSAICKSDEAMVI